MKIEVMEIKYLYRKNLGNYEHEETAMTAKVPEGYDPAAALEELRSMVLGTPAEGKPAHPTQGETAAPEVKADAAPKKEKKHKKTEVTVTEDKVEVKTETDEDESQLKFEEKEETTPAPEPKAEKKAAPKVKKKAAAASPYDRANDLHKKLLGEYLDQSFPQWRTKMSAKAAAASKELVGQDFLDAEGMIVQSFKDRFAEMMA